MINNIVSFSEAARPTLLPELLTRYEIIERMSGTPHSETLLLKSKESGKRMIAKLYRKSFVSEGGELAILSRLDHPGIPKPVEGSSAKDEVCVVREYVEGFPLDELDIPLDRTRALNIALQLCDILTYLHSRTPPVIHRDIKPQNVILDYENRVHLIDFGISRHFSDSAAKDTTFIGTAGFAPPEQYGFKQTDRRTDIYSLGVTLCFLLTGGRDLRGLEGLGNKRLARTVRKCAAFAPEDRYPTSEAAKKALTDTFKKHKRQVWLVTAACAALALTVAVWFLFALSPHNTVADTPPVTSSTAEVRLNTETSPVRSSAPASPESSSPSAEPAETASPPTVESPDDGEPVVFREPLIERAVRANLGLDDDVVLTTEDIQFVRGIFIYSDMVFPSSKKLTDYRETLVYGFHEYSGDIPLVSSLEDFAMLTNLQEIMINNQDVQIYDLKPLTSLTKLSALEIIPSSIIDLSPLEEIQSISVLSLCDAPYTDISPLTRMRNLTHINFYGCEFDPGQMRGLKYVIELGVSSTREDNWEYLPDRPLRSIDISSCSIDSITHLDAYKATLKNLYITWGKLTSLEGIEGFVQLRLLDICHNDIDDLSPLLSLPFLNELRVSSNMYGAVKKIRDRANFTIVFVD